MSDPETIGVYNKRVGEYVAMTEDLQQTAEIAAFTNQVTPAGYILDLGCGPGNTAAFFQQMGFRVDAVDASAEMVRVAKTRFQVAARCAEFSDISTHNMYDGIWANFSLLHAQPNEFPDILAALFKALKPGGVFHIGMKLGEGAARDHLGRYYCYYSQDSLRSLLTAAGFVVIDTQFGQGPGLAGTVDPWILFLSTAEKAEK